MSDPKQPIDWTAQDWLLVIEALARYRWYGDTDPDRAWRLIEGIAAEQGLQPSECLLQLGNHHLYR